MALAVISVQLYDKDGAAIQASDPIHLSVPLPSDTHNRMATSIPVWLYQPHTGAFGPRSSQFFSVLYDLTEVSAGLWVRNGTGYIQKDGSQFVWNVMVAQMGYWLAAFPSSSGREISSVVVSLVSLSKTIFFFRFFPHAHSSHAHKSGDTIKPS